MNVKLRLYQEADVQQILNLFNETIRNVNNKDYTQGQLAKWYQVNPNYKEWKQKFLQSITYVATIDKQIVGFGNRKSNLIDCLYVDYRFVGQGIGTKLLKRLLVGQSHCEAYASITAKPFFEKFDFRVVKKIQNKRGNEILMNYYMKQ